MTTTSDMGLSLWLVPSPEEKSRLQPVLDRLARDAKGPAFQAHVTLLSISSSTPLPLPRLSLGQHAPITLGFLRVESGQTYFQSVLIAVGLSPELQLLHDTTRQILNKPLPAGTPYFPHISLFYGGDGQEFKDLLVKQLYEDGTAVESDGGVSVAGLSRVHVKDVWLVRTEGPPEKWEVLEKWELGVVED